MGLKVVPFFRYFRAKVSSIWVHGPLRYGLTSRRVVEFCTSLCGFALASLGFWCGFRRSYTDVWGCADLKSGFYRLSNASLVGVTGVQVQFGRFKMDIDPNESTLCMKLYFEIIVRRSKKVGNSGFK